MKFRQDIVEKEGMGADLFVKLKDKESVSGVFRGDMREFFVVWEGGKPVEVPEGTPKSTFRFRVNFIVKDGPSYTVKIFEQGTAAYKALAEINEEYPLEDTVIKISRSGSAKNDTSYSFMPLAKQDVPKSLGEMKLHELGPKPSDDEEELPF